MIPRNCAAPELSLIPPSPVSSQINVELRAGVRNTTATRQHYQVSFHLTGGDRPEVLHEAGLTLEAGQAGCVKFHWPTADHAGQHEVLLRVKSDGQAWEARQPLTILEYPSRSVRRIDGAFSGLLHWSDQEGRLWNEELRRMTEEDWRALTRAQHALGMPVLVLQQSFLNNAYVDRHSMDTLGYPGQAFYDSALYPGRVEITAPGALEATLDEADTLGMQVFMPVGLYAWFDFSAGSLRWHKEVAAELWERFGHHASFYGWYVSEEVFGTLGETPRHREEIVRFFEEFSAHCRALAPAKPIMLAPNCHGITLALDYYKRLLPNLDIICPFGFHRMPPGDMSGREAADLLQELCDQAGSHLWLDMEAFLFHEDQALYPRPIEQIEDDLERYQNFEKIICYQFPGLFNAPDARLIPGGPDTVKLYLDYQNYLRLLDSAYSRCG